MRKAFLEFLVGRGSLAPQQVEQVRSILRGAPEPIGSIAFSYGMISGGDIDDILDEQQFSREPFGEIAIRKGLLTREQLETLLGVQQMRAATETAEALALSGLLPMDEVTRLLGRFLSECYGSAVCRPS